MVGKVTSKQLPCVEARIDWKYSCTATSFTTPHPVKASLCTVTVPGPCSDESS